MHLNSSLKFPIYHILHTKYSKLFLILATYYAETGILDTFGSSIRTLPPDLYVFRRKCVAVDFTPSMGAKISVTNFATSSMLLASMMICRSALPEITATSVTSGNFAIRIAIRSNPNSRSDWHSTSMKAVIFI